MAAKVVAFIQQLLFQIRLTCLGAYICWVSVVIFPTTALTPNCKYRAFFGESMDNFHQSHHRPRQHAHHHNDFGGMMGGYVVKIYICGYYCLLVTL